MAVTWSVVSLDSTKTVGSLSDVVTTVHWTATLIVRLLVKTHIQEAHMVL